MTRHPGGRPRIGLALGGGAARGWAHIGVLDFLRAIDLVPDVVCGTSVGAVVGAMEVTGRLPEFRQWVLGLEWQDVLAYLDVTFSGGLIQGARLMNFFRERMIDPGLAIETLERPFGAVATDLASGQEVWLQSGPVLEAVRASIALPGLFTPVARDGRWLVDGGLVNPVPVSLCRALGADRIIAVDLNADLLGRRSPVFRARPTSPEREEAAAPEAEAEDDHWLERLRRKDWQGALNAALGLDLPSLRDYFQRDTQAPPSVIDILGQSINIMQVRITRARMAGDPPDVLLQPRLSGIRLLEFHRAREAIDEGYRAAEAAASELVVLKEERA